MITNWKTIVMAMALLMAIASVLVISSCSSSEDEPEPEPIEPPSALSYPATTVAVGAEGTITPTISGDAATFEITDLGDADGVVAITVDMNTGVLSVPMESTTGVYTVEVTATNSEGSTTGTAEVTIGINEDFDPTGQGYLWKYFISQDDPWTMSGLDGIPGLPIQTLEIPTGWPPDWPVGNADWNEQYLLPYLALGGVADLLFQVPGDIACENVGERGDTVYFEVEDDLTLTTICNVDGVAGQSVLIGTSSISYADGQFSWTIVQYSQIEVTYIVNNPTAETFIDPLDETTPGRQFPALRGTVDQFTIPTNVFDEAGILTSLSQKKVEVILEVLDL